MTDIVEDKQKYRGIRVKRSLLGMANVQFQQIRKEFVPLRLVKERENWVCPICRRDHHKKPGPFSLEVTSNKIEGTLAFSVEARGCCKWEQDFSIDDIRHGKVDASSLIPQLRRSFYTR